MTDDHRRITPETVAELRERISIFSAIVTGLDRWPEVSDLAFHAPTQGAFIEQLRNLLDLDEVQAQALMDVQVRRITQDQRSRIRATLDGHEADLASAIEELGL